MNTPCPPATPLTTNEFFQLSEFFQEDQLKNPHDHGLVIKGHHYENGIPDLIDLRLDRPIPLTPEESQTLVEYLTYKEPKSWGLPEYEDWIGIVTDPEFKDDIPHRDKEVMIEDWDKWVQEVQEKENLLAAQARSPQISGEYLVPRQDIRWGVSVWTKRFEDGSARLFLDGDWDNRDEYSYPPWEDFAEARGLKFPLFCGSLMYPEQRRRSVLLGSKGQNSEVFDSENKMIVNAIITHQGTNYHTARCDKGAIYIPLKFTSYIPKVGGDVRMIVRLKEADRACPLACVKVLKY